MATRHGPALPPVTVPARFSFGLIVLLCALHGLPLLACLGSGVPMWARWLLCIGVAVSAALNFRGARRLHGMSLRLLSRGEVQILQDGREIAGQRAAGTADLAVMLVIIWQDEDGRVGRCCLMRDGMSAEDWRQARIWLRWSQLAEQEPAM